MIVESYESGGSLITAEYADARDRTLLAVPGSAFSPASVGTHDLLRTKDAWLCTSAADVLVALKLAGSTGSNDARQSESESEPEVRVPSEDHETVLALLCWEPTSFHDLARHATFALPKLAGIVEDLVSLGFCDNRDGSLVRSRRAAQSLNRGKSFP